MSGANLDRVVGRILGERYELVSRIGSGASAEVFAATDLRLGRSVAVKQLRSDLTEDVRFRKLFRTEAHLAAQLSHPNIVTVFDWSDDADGHDGGAYIVSELLAGGTLRHVLDTAGTLSLAQAAFIGLQAAQGLAAAHDQGLVHRDIKPANLLFGHDGRIHIADFGIARAVAEAAWTEPEGVLIGTARYAAPEQATAGPVDGLVDVYSLTVCLIESLTGRVPLVRENALGTMILRQTEDLPVDESFGVLAEPLAMAGLADAGQRSTADELLEGMLAACRELPDPEPLELIDVTDLGRADAGTNGDDASHSWQPNVRFDTGGDLIIDGESSSLAIPVDEGAEARREETGRNAHDKPSNRRGEPSDVTGKGEKKEPDGPLTDKTSDEYLTLSHRTRRGKRAGRLLLLLVVFALLGVGALAAGRLVGESRQPEVAPTEVGLPSYLVDDYRGLTLAEADPLIESNGWRVTVAEAHKDGTEPGRILRQTPAPGERMGRGGDLAFVVSLGPELRLLPELVGRPSDEVTLDIESVNLEVGEIVERFDESVMAGVVIEATIGGVPARPGTEHLTGTIVDLVVSSGPSPREVPPLIGLTVEQARVAINDVDLVLATAEAFSETVPEGEIISVTPEAGSAVSRGGTVTVTVSQGKPFIEVPDVKGMKVSEAIDVLKAEGFEVKIDGSVGSAVLETRPLAGQSVRLGSLVTILASEG